MAAKYLRKKKWINSNNPPNQRWSSAPSESAKGFRVLELCFLLSRLGRCAAPCVFHLSNDQTTAPTRSSDLRLRSTGKGMGPVSIVALKPAQSQSNRANDKPKPCLPGTRSLSGLPPLRGKINSNGRRASFEGAAGKTCLYAAVRVRATP